MPNTRPTRNRTIKMPNSTRAIPAAVPAMPPKPRAPATSATIRNTNAQYSTSVPPRPFLASTLVLQGPRPSFTKLGATSRRIQGKGMENFTGKTGSSLLSASPPVVDAFSIKAPIAADSEGGDLSFSQQAIDRTRMDVQIFRHFRHGHYLVVFLHLTTL